MVICPAVPGYHTMYILIYAVMEELVYGMVIYPAVTIYHTMYILIYAVLEE